MKGVSGWKGAMMMVRMVSMRSGVAYMAQMEETRRRSTSGEEAYSIEKGRQGTRSVPGFVLPRRTAVVP